MVEQTFSNKLLDKTLHASAGTIVITNPEEVHASFCDNKVGTTFFTFYVSADVLTNLNNNQPVFFDQKIIMDNKLFNKLYTLSQSDYTAHNKIEIQLLLVLKELTRKYAIHDHVTGTESKLFQRFLEDETFEKFSLEKTASGFGLDKFKFLRLFKQQTGLTPNNYIILKRIEKCKELLHTEDDLLQIAIQTGFYDATHLCKHFKRITGITPQAYREA